MSTARTTPAQKPRGRTRRSTFPLVSVGIFFLSQWFIKLYHTLGTGFLGWKLVVWLTSKSGRLRKAGPTKHMGGELEEKATDAGAGCGCESPRRPASTSPRLRPACRDESRVHCRLR